MPAKFLDLEAWYKMEELARTALISASQQVIQLGISPYQRKKTTWGCGDEGKNGHRMVSAGRKGAVGSSHPWLPTAGKQEFREKLYKIETSGEELG